ncbi:hypothetical protein ACW6QP_15290 [Salegentibacter sp. HM20]
MRDITDEGRLCATGPAGLAFEVVNETTGENLFEDESFEENQLQIRNNDGENVDFEIIPERNVVSVLLGWESKSDIYTVSIREEIEFDIAFTLEKSSSEGCTSTRLTELDILGGTYEISDTTGVVSIFVNPD